MAEQRYKDWPANAGYTDDFLIGLGLKRVIPDFCIHAYWREKRGIASSQKVSAATEVPAAPAVAAVVAAPPTAVAVAPAVPEARPSRRRPVRPHDPGTDWSVHQIAHEKGMSDETVRKWFTDEEGVFKDGNPETMHKRGHITLRIPDKVKDRVFARKTVRKN